MSCEIVKGIKIGKDKVLIKSESNNVYPKNFTWGESVLLSRTLKEKGKEAVELEILDAYLSGDFQAGAENKYTKAKKYLLFEAYDKYSKFDWRRDDFDFESSPTKDCDEYEKLLREALSYKSKDKFVIQMIDLYGEKNYLKMRKNSRYCTWVKDKEKAKKFDFYNEAENLKKIFYDSDKWQIVRAN